MKEEKKLELKKDVIEIDEKVFSSHNEDGEFSPDSELDNNSSSYSVGRVPHLFG